MVADTRKFAFPPAARPDLADVVGTVGSFLPGYIPDYRIIY